MVGNTGRSETNGAGNHVWRSGREPTSCAGLCRVAKLLVASHIKPWADCDDRERLDPLNGVAACPTHDAAFDTGLITVNGGLRVHRAPELETSVRTDPGVDQYFGRALKPTLYVPEQGRAPSDSYLSWHRERIFQGSIGR